MCVTVFGFCLTGRVLGGVNFGCAFDGDQLLIDGVLCAILAYVGRRV